MQVTQDTIFQDIPELQWVESRSEGGARRPIKSYVLRGGSYLKSFQVEAVKRYYATYGIPFRQELLDYPPQVYGNENPLVIEIGFGMGGTATSRIAKERNQYNYLCLEVFLSGGFTKLLDVVGGREGLDNVRLMRLMQWKCFAP